jgi:hypothetical protein
LLLAGVNICAISYAQSVGQDGIALKIKVMPDNFLVIYENRSTTIASMASLDSCLKAIVPGRGHQSVDIESTNAIDRERVDAIQKLLAPYHCPVRSTCDLVRSGQPAPPLKRQQNR